MLSYTNPASGQCGCECGDLPNTITLAFSGLPSDGRSEYRRLNPTSCFGGNATAVLLAADEPGPITQVKLVRPGRCYASLGRVQPTLVAYGNGTGAYFDIALTKSDDGCGRDRWAISGITVEGGQGYTNNSLLTIAAAAGDTTEIPAVARVRSTGGVPTSVTVSNGGRYYREVSGDRDVPVLSIEPVGCGARFDLTLEKDATADPPVWSVSGVAVEAAGSGCAAGNLVFKTGDLTVAETPAVAAYTVNHQGQVDGVVLTDAGRYYRDVSEVEPYVADVVFSASGGSGGEVRGVVDSDPASETFGEVVSLTITKAGNGYTAYTPETTCVDELNGQKVVLQASDPVTLVRVCARPSFGTPPTLAIDYDSYDGVPGPLPEPTIVPTVGGGNLAGFGMARKGRVAPTLTLAPAQGSGATFGIKLHQQQTSEGFDYWSISDVTASGGGSGYVDGGGGAVSLAAGDSVESAAAYRIWTRTLPSVTITVPEPDGFEGESAELTATLERLPGYPPLWTISSIAIDKGGTEYPSVFGLNIQIAEPDYAAKPAAAVAYADAAGKITAVAVEYGGEYYRSQGNAVEVQILDGGNYYRESDAAEPYVADVPVLVEQIPPSAGTGAKVSLEIDTSPTSATFGRALAVSLDAEGSGYALLGGPRDCRYQVECGNGALWALLMGNEDSAAQSSAMTSGRNRGLEVQLRPSVSSNTGPSDLRFGVFRSATGIVDCDVLPTTLQLSHDIESGSVAVTRGGRYLGKRGHCCRGCACDNNPDLSHIASVTVTITAEIEDCEANGTVTLVLNEANEWQAAQNIGDTAVAFASFFCTGSFFAVTADVGNAGGNNCFVCPEQNVVFFARSLRMDSQDLNGRCVPIGFAGWSWQTSQGDPYILFEPGNEIPQGCSGTSVTVSATVALA